MVVYSYSKINASKKIKRRVFMRLPAFVIAGVMGLYFANIDSNGMIFNSRLSLILSVLLVTTLLIIGAAYSIMLGVRVLVKEKYILTDASIEKITFSGTSIKMDLDKIETPSINNKGLMLVSNGDKIFISAELDGYHELTKKLLAKLR